MMTDLAPGLPQVFADAHQIQQVLLNLVINAEQAMLAANGRGTLIVRTWHDAEDTRQRPRSSTTVRASQRRCRQDLRPVLHDEGSRQGHRSRPHRGLRDRAGARRAHPCGSPAAGGASFVVELPLSATDTAARPRAELPPMDAVRGASVLMVEDERALAAAVAER